MPPRRVTKIGWVPLALNAFAGAVIVGHGEVSRDVGLKLSAPIRIPSSPAQDRELLREMDKQLINPPAYNAFAANCVNWSAESIAIGMKTKGEAVPADIPGNVMLKLGKTLDPHGTKNLTYNDIIQYVKGLSLVPGAGWEYEGSHPHPPKS